MRLTYRDSTVPHTNKKGELWEAYSDYPYNEVINKLATYEDMEEQGLLVRLPCKVRDSVYYLTGNPSMVSGRNFNRVESTKAIGFYWDEKGLQICLYMPHGNHGTYGYFGDTIFLSREEAEAALKGVQINE